MSTPPILEATIVKLHEISGIKFGEFKLKGGIMSPVYFDLRVIVSKPKLLNQVSQLLWQCNPDSSKSDILCGVPYTALPLATLMSVEHDVPSIIRRKEIKQYGTKKIIEGDFQPGQKCLIVEDVITSGSSVLETAAILRDHGLVVEDVVVFLDRQQGGKENLENNGIRVHSVTNVENMMAVLAKAGKVSQQETKTVLDFVKGHKAEVVKPAKDPFTFSYEERAANHCANNPLAKLILEKMVAKKSNLCVAVDVGSVDELLRIADRVGPHVFCLKTHVDILNDWSPEVPEKLTALAKKHDFLLFEDRKLADIGKTVSGQFYQGPFNIGQWCHLVTIHGIAGPGVVQGLQDGATSGGGGRKGALIVAEMSSQDNLITPDYSQKCVDMFRKFKEAESEGGVSTVGLIGQSRLCTDADCIQMTPGVSLTAKGDGLGQTYVSVEEAVVNKGADAVIVGRGVTGGRAASDDQMVAAAQAYQKEGWEAYLKRCSL